MMMRLSPIVMMNAWAVYVRTVWEERMEDARMAENQIPKKKREEKRREEKRRKEKKRREICYRHAGSLSRISQKDCVRRGRASSWNNFQSRLEPKAAATACKKTYERKKEKEKKEKEEQQFIEVLLSQREQDGKFLRWVRSSLRSARRWVVGGRNFRLERVRKNISSSAAFCFNSLNFFWGINAWKAEKWMEEETGDHERGNDKFVRKSISSFPAYCLSESSDIIHGISLTRSMHGKQKSEWQKEQYKLKQCRQKSRQTKEGKRKECVQEGRDLFGHSVSVNKPTLGEEGRKAAEMAIVVWDPKQKWTDAGVREDESAGEDGKGRGKRGRSRERNGSERICCPVIQ